MQFHYALRLPDPLLGDFDAGAEGVALVWIDAVTVVAFVLTAALVYAAADAALAQAARLSLARGEPWSKP